MRRNWLPFVLLAVGAPSASVSADLFKPSVKDQIALGQKAAAQVRKEERVLPDSDPRVKEIRRIGRLLVQQIPKSERDKKPFQYTFDVVDNKEVNAFALPGGPVFIYTGLLQNLQTEDQVAGVLGHELAHVRYEHWASSYANNQKRQLGISLVLILLNANSAVFDVASISDALIFQLPYSRSHESAADKSGYDTMVAADFNPQGLVDVFKVLKEKGGSKRTEEWLSSHPDADKRIRNLEKRIADSNVSYPAQKKLGSGITARNTLSSRRALPVVN